MPPPPASFHRNRPAHQSPRNEGVHILEFFPGLVRFAVPGRAFTRPSENPGFRAATTDPAEGYEKQSVSGMISTPSGNYINEIKEIAMVEPRSDLPVPSRYAWRPRTLFSLHLHPDHRLRRHPNEPEMAGTPLAPDQRPGPQGRAAVRRHPEPAMQPMPQPTHGRSTLVGETSGIRLESNTARRRPATPIPWTPGQNREHSKRSTCFAKIEAR